MKAIKGRVLILDDDVLVAVNYKDCLESHAFSCRLAHRIQDAYHFLKNNDYDIVFCDHDLPDGKGLDFIKKVIQEHPDLPFIYLSAASPSVLREAAKIEQVKRVLTKPVNEQDILQVLNECNIKPKLRKRFIGPIERKMILEIHRDAGNQDKS
jgi:DNA-binding NtrC family response regulator